MSAFLFRCAGFTLIVGAIFGAGYTLGRMISDARDKSSVHVAETGTFSVTYNGQEYEARFQRSGDEVMILAAPFAGASWFLPNSKSLEGSSLVIQRNFP